MEQNVYSSRALTPALVTQAPSRPTTSALWRFLMVLAVLCLGLAGSANASHFRYGNITWRTITTDPSKRTVEIKVSESFRTTYFTSGALAVGSVVGFADYLYFGDGGGTYVDLTVTSVDAAADNFYGEFTVTHTYATAGAYNANINSGARIGTLVNNAGLNWHVETIINAGSGNNSPVSTLPAVVNLATSQAAATFQLPANDPDGDPLTYSLATTTDMGGNAFTNAPGLGIDATTGVITFPTTGKAVNTLYDAIVKVSDGKTSIMVDFIIQITSVSTPPVFDYLITPSAGYVYQVAPGTPVNFSVRATDSDPNSTVTLKAVGLPTGSAMNPGLPTTANPVLSAFSWTPTASNLGTYVITFVAQDNVGVQTNTSVTIQVSIKPTFDVPPTPSNGSVVQITPGTLVTRTIQASNVDRNTLVSIISATGLASASYSPALPSTAGNPTSTQLNWTPVISNWGLNTVTFTAKNTNSSDQKTHTLDFIVNSAPSFTSTPTLASLNVVAGRLFTYNITLADPDLTYGDMLEIETPNLPSWLTLVDNGDGTGTLSGTPAVADAGNNAVDLVAADLYHHGASYGLIHQRFVINVIPCTVQAVAQNVSVSLGANGTASVTAAQVDNGSTASCGIASVVVSPTTFGCANLGANLVVLTVTDVNGYVQTANAIVTVTDTQKPVLTVPANMAVNTSAGICGAVVNFAPMATDNCTVASLVASPASGSTFNVGTTTVNVTATDAAGNQSIGSFTVTVTDVTAPTAYAKNVTVTLVNGAATVSAAQVNNVSYDACGIDSYSLSKTSFNCSNIGANNVTLTVTDIHGNTSTASAVVNVVGAVPVTTITASSIVGGRPTMYLGYGSPSITLTALSGTLTNVSYVWSGLAATSLSTTTNASTVFTPTVEGTYTFNVTATSNSGCTSTATIKIYVEDVRCGNGSDKVQVCHNGNAICVAYSALSTHLAHGDKVGDCKVYAARGTASPTTNPATTVNAANTANELSAFPNPVTENATVSFRTALDGPAQVTVYNQLGQRIATLYDGAATAGQLYSFTLKGQNLATGLYVCRLVTNNKTETLRLIIAR